MVCCYWRKNRNDNVAASLDFDPFVIFLSFGGIFGTEAAPIYLELAFENKFGNGVSLGDFFLHLFCMVSH